MTFIFEPAVKAALKARTVIEGPGGCGKTWTALVLAGAFGERTAVVDTQNRQSLHYASLFAFDALHLRSFDPATLFDVIAAAEGYDTLIIDSGSSFWSGTDGMLEQVDRRAGFTGGGWKDMRPVERRMLDALMAYSGHLIVTLRVKTGYVVEENESGKQKPRKVGLKPEQRDGFDYEFDLVLSMDADNTAMVTKTRCPTLAGQVIRKPGPELGSLFLDWLSDGKQEKTATEFRDEALQKYQTADSLRDLWREANRANRVSAPLTDENANPTTLGEMIVRLGQEAAAREKGQPA